MHPLTTSPDMVPRRRPVANFLDRKPQSASERQLLFDVAVTEFMTASLFSLVATSIVVARMNGRSVRLAGPPENYLPRDATVLPHAMPALAALKVSPNILKSIHGLHTRATFAARFSAPVFTELCDHPSARQGDLTAIHAVWMSVCSAAFLGIHFLYEEERFPDEGQESGVRLIRDSIKSIGQGGSPFVRSDATIFIPGWLDHRRDERRQLGWPIALHYGAARVPGLLDNVSRTGMGLTSDAPMTVGRPVVAVLQNGRRMEGTIVWTDGHHCGAAFQHALTDDDPLIL